MAAQEINTEGKTNINDEFMSGFGIESTSLLDNNDLANFLDSDDTIVGEPAAIVAAPKPKVEPPKSDKSKEEIIAAKEKELAEKQQGLDDLLNSDDTPPKRVPTLADPNQAEEPADEAIQENLGAVSKEFYRLGLFTKDSEDEEEAIKDPQAFIDKVQTTFKRGTQAYLENYLSHFSPKNKELFFATYEKGVDPATYLAQLNKVESYEKMDLKKEENQEYIVAAALRNQDWEEDDIKDQITKLKSYSELEDTALKYHKGLVKSEKAHTKELEDNAQQEQARLQQIDEDYDNNLRVAYTEKLKEKDFDGLPITDGLVQKAYDFAYNKKWELNGTLLTDFDRFILDLKKPENHAVKAKLALLFAPEYDPNKPIKVDFSKIQKRAVSKESTTLFKDLATKSKGGNKGQSAYANVTKSFFD